MNILIIEDEKQIREIFAEIFRANGYNVFTACDGVEGIEKSKTILPDIILCDILMPRKDGFEVKQALSLDINTSGIPFLFLTAKSSPEDFSRGMKLGADDYILKPIRARDLLEAVANRLKRIKEVQTSANFNAPEKKKKLLLTDKILIKVDGVPAFIEISSIIVICAEGYYSYIHLDDGQKHLIKKSLKTWEEILPDNTFKRMHRNSIVNINFIEKVENWYKSTYRVKLKKHDDYIYVSQVYAKKLRLQFKL
jgi:DNA-binding LytR/AlgR family response regulator